MKLHILKKQRGQVWVADLVLSVLLFSAAVIAAFAILMNGFGDGNEFESTAQDATRIGSYLLSEGVPLSWNDTNVIRPGLVSYGRINQSKTTNAMKISNESYGSLKAMLQTRNDFLVLFENGTGDILTVSNYCAIGDPAVAVETYANATLQCEDVNFSQVDYDNLVRITRYVVYDSKIVKMKIYVWN